MTCSVGKTRRGRYLCKQHAARFEGTLLPLVANEGYEHQCEMCQKVMNKLMARYRQVCSGCYNDRYNHQSAGDVRNAPTAGTGCYHLPHIKRNKCGYGELLRKSGH